MWMLWLIVGIIFSVCEVFYSGFFLIWFAIGAFCTIIISFFTQNILYQSIVFLVVSITLLLTLTKYFTRKFLSKNYTATNIDSLIGKTGIVTQDIGKDNFEAGLVKLDGEIWTAVSENGAAIAKGSTVVIQQIKGVRLIVTQTENKGGL